MVKTIGVTSKLGLKIAARRINGPCTVNGNVERTTSIAKSISIQLKGRGRRCGGGEGIRPRWCSLAAFGDVKALRHGELACCAFIMKWSTGGIRPGWCSLAAFGDVKALRHGELACCAFIMKWSVAHGENFHPWKSVEYEACRLKNFVPIPA